MNQETIKLPIKTIKVEYINEPNTRLEKIKRMVKYGR